MTQVIEAPKKVVKERELICCYDSTIDCEFDDLGSYSSIDYAELWNDFLYDVKWIMGKMKTSKFYCFSKAMGWQRRSGFNVFEAETPQSLMNSIMPNTSDVYIKVYKSEEFKNGYDFVIAHHDSTDCMTVISQHKAKKLKLSMS